jgi:hypothetical protein
MACALRRYGVTDSGNIQPAILPRLKNSVYESEGRVSQGRWLLSPSDE